MLLKPAKNFKFVQIVFLFSKILKVSHFFVKILNRQMTKNVATLVVEVAYPGTRIGIFKKIMKIL
jgi:hypothetical protein